MAHAPETALLPQFDRCEGIGPRFRAEVNPEFLINRGRTAIAALAGRHFDEIAGPGRDEEVLRRNVVERSSGRATKHAGFWRLTQLLAPTLGGTHKALIRNRQYQGFYTARTARSTRPRTPAARA